MTPFQLQKLLDRAAISQRKAAKLIGISERMMRRYTAGLYPIPKTVEIAVECICLHGDKLPHVGKAS